MDSPESSPAPGVSVVLPSTSRPTRVSLDDTRVESARLNRSASDASLKDFYGVGVKRQPSLERRIEERTAAGRGTPSPGPGARPIVSYQTQTRSTQQSSHSASILPSAAFFNPKRPGRSPVVSASLLLSASPDSPADRASPRFSSTLEVQDSTRRTPNGPLITRVSTDYSARGEKLVTRRFSGEATAEDGPREFDRADDVSLGRLTRAGHSNDTLGLSGGGGGGWGSIVSDSRPSSPYGESNASMSNVGMHARTISTDDSSHGHGNDYTTITPARSSLENPPPIRLPMSSKASREPLLDFPTTAAKNANMSSPTPSRASLPRHTHSRSLSDDLKSTPKKVEDAVQRARLSFSNMSMSRSGSGDGRMSRSASGDGRPPGSQPLPDVPSSGEYERSEVDKQMQSAPVPPNARETPAPGPPPPPAPATMVEIPYEPVLDEKGRKLRNYQLHPGSNRFFLAGRLVSSKDNPVPFTVSLCIAIALPGAFFAFTAPYLWQHLGGGGKASIFIFAWLAGMMITSMCRTAWTDPGILPRGLDKVPERKWIEDLGGPGVGGWKAEPKYMRIKEGVVASKWCETCGTYRPPRTSHCRLCDNCVDHTDHHCTFLNNCIGRRNYTSFFAFLVTSILCSVYAVVFSAWHISSRHSEDPSSWASHWDTIGSFVVCVLAFGLFLPIFGLFSYHLRLLWTNRTTIEMLRPTADRSGGINPANGEAMGNLYALNSPFANVVSLLCRPMEVPSWIAPHRYALRDPREEEGEGEGKERA